MNTGAGDHESEEELLHVLSSFLKKHSDFHLTIFLHPREKKLVEFPEVEKHYQEYFSGSAFVFVEQKNQVYCFSIPLISGLVQLAPFFSNAFYGT